MAESIYSNLKQKSKTNRPGKTLKKMGETYREGMMGNKDGQNDRAKKADMLQMEQIQMTARKGQHEEQNARIQKKKKTEGRKNRDCD